jgi:hypothetical protein
MNEVQIDPDTSIDQLKRLYGRRFRNVQRLRRWNFQTVRDLSRVSPEWIRERRACGHATVAQVTDLLEAAGLKMKCGFPTNHRWEDCVCEMCTGVSRQIASPKRFTARVLQNQRRFCELWAPLCGLTPEEVAEMHGFDCFKEAP